MHVMEANSLDCAAHRYNDIRPESMSVGARFF